MHRFILETGVTIINIEQLFHEAVEAFNNNEMNDDDEDNTEMDTSMKIDHENVLVSTGNTSSEHAGRIDFSNCSIS